MRFIDDVLFTWMHGGSSTQKEEGRGKAGQGEPTAPNVKIDKLLNPIKFSKKRCGVMGSQLEKNKKLGLRFQ